LPPRPQLQQTFGLAVSTRQSFGSKRFTAVKPAVYTRKEGEIETKSGSFRHKLTMDVPWEYRFIREVGAWQDLSGCRDALMPAREHRPSALSSATRSVGSATPSRRAPPETTQSPPLLPGKPWVRRPAAAQVPLTLTLHNIPRAYHRLSTRGRWGQERQRTEAEWRVRDGSGCGTGSLGLLSALTIPGSPVPPKGQTSRMSRNTLLSGRVQGVYKGCSSGVPAKIL